MAAKNKHHPTKGKEQPTYGQMAKEMHHNKCEVCAFRERTVYLWIMIHVEKSTSSLQNVKAQKHQQK